LCNAFSVRNFIGGPFPRVGRWRGQPWATVCNRVAVKNAALVACQYRVLRHAVDPPTTWLWLFGFVTAPIGLALWHRQGASFGLGAAQGRVSRSIAYATLSVCLTLLVLGFAIGGRVTASQVADFGELSRVAVVPPAQRAVRALFR
jgi:hypothetical protein